MREDFTCSIFSSRWFDAFLFGLADLDLDFRLLLTASALVFLAFLAEPLEEWLESRLLDDLELLELELDDREFELLELPELELGLRLFDFGILLY